MYIELMIQAIVKASPLGARSGIDFAQMFYMHLSSFFKRSLRGVGDKMIMMVFHTNRWSSPGLVFDTSQMNFHNN